MGKETGHNMPTDPLASTGATATKKQPKDTSKVAKPAKAKKSKEGANPKKPTPKVTKKQVKPEKKKRPRDEGDAKESKAKKSKAKAESEAATKSDDNARPAIFKEMEQEDVTYVGQYTKMMRTVRQFMDEIAEDAVRNHNGLVQPVVGATPYSSDDTTEKLKLRNADELRASKSVINMVRYVLQVMLYREYHNKSIMCQLTHKKTLSPEMVHAADLMCYTGNPMLSACFPKDILEQVSSQVQDWEEIYPTAVDEEGYSKLAFNGIKESLALTGHAVEDKDDVAKCIESLKSSMLAIEEA